MIESLKKRSKKTTLDHEYAKFCKLQSLPATLTSDYAANEIFVVTGDLKLVKIVRDSKMSFYTARAKRWE